MEQCRAWIQNELKTKNSSCWYLLKLEAVAIQKVISTKSIKLHLDNTNAFEYLLVRLSSFHHYSGIGCASVYFCTTVWSETWRLLIIINEVAIGISLLKNIKKRALDSICFSGTENIRIMIMCLVEHCNMAYVK